MSTWLSSCTISERMSTLRCRCAAAWTDRRSSIKTPSRILHSRPHTPNSRFIHNTQRKTVTSSTRHSHLAHFTPASFSCSRRATYTALTDTDQSHHTPRVNPGSEPVQSVSQSVISRSRPALTPPPALSPAPPLPVATFHNTHARSHQHEKRNPPQHHSKRATELYGVLLLLGRGCRGELLLPGPGFRPDLDRVDAC